MEYFRKGFPPPPYFWKLRVRWGTIQFWSQKGEKLNFPITPKITNPLFSVDGFPNAPTTTNRSPPQPQKNTVTIIACSPSLWNFLGF